MSSPPPSPWELATSKGRIRTYAQLKVNPRITSPLQKYDAPISLSSANYNNKYYITVTI